MINTQTYDMWTAVFMILEAAMIVMFHRNSV